MKAKLLFVVLVGCALWTQAQGTFQFTIGLSGANEVPPNNSLGTGSGTLTLNGSTLSFDIEGAYWAFPTNATINGPAGTSSTAPVLYDLGPPSIVVPNPPLSGGYVFRGSVNNLTSSNINDLLEGLWYMHVSSGSPDNGDIRGQIVPVPEPSVLALLGLGICGFGVWRCCRSRVET